MGGEVLYLEGVFVERMGGEVHPHELLLLLQYLQHVFLAYRSGHLRPLGLHFLHFAEERRGGRDGVVLIELRVADEFVDEEFAGGARSEELAAPVAEGVERASAYEGFKGLAVHGAGEALHEVEHICEGASGLALSDDGVGYVAAETLEAAETEADVAAGVHGEVAVGLVHIGVQHLDAGLLAVGHDLLELVHVGRLLGEVRRLEFRRIVGLEPGRLVAYPGVAGSVTLVESILCERLPVGPNLLERFLVMPALEGALHEVILEAVEHVFLFLTHGLAELVRLAAGEAGHLAGNLHHLLLVHRDAVGLL